MLRSQVWISAAFLNAPISDHHATNPYVAPMLCRNGAVVNYSHFGKGRSDLPMMEQRFDVPSVRKLSLSVHLDLIRREITPRNDSAKHVWLAIKNSGTRTIPNMFEELFSDAEALLPRSSISYLLSKTIAVQSAAVSRGLIGHLPWITAIKQIKIAGYFAKTAILDWVNSKTTQNYSSKLQNTFKATVSSIRGR